MKMDSISPNSKIKKNFFKFNKQFRSLGNDHYFSISFKLHVKSKTNRT